MLLPLLLASGAEVEAEESQWQLVWSDEFEGTEIDPSKWDFDIDCWGGGNEERQCYRRENASIEDGKLIITARREEATGAAWPLHMRSNRDMRDATKTQPFTSARLVTRGKASWRYGKIEVRAKLPQGQGAWPAIWMLPEENAYGGWAASGEIDILEVINLGAECPECPGGRENDMLGTLHFGGPPPANEMASSRVTMPGSIDDFHTFGLVWSEGEFVWTVDGLSYARKIAKDWHSSASDDPIAPFDQAFHLLLNFAVGGRWPESENEGGYSAEGFPKRMEVDWVRVWQCAPDAASDCSN